MTRCVACDTGMCPQPYGEPHAATRHHYNGEGMRDEPDELVPCTCPCTD